MALPSFARYFRPAPTAADRALVLGRLARALEPEHSRRLRLRAGQVERLARRLRRATVALETELACVQAGHHD